MRIIVSDETNACGRAVAKHFRRRGDVVFTPDGVSLTSEDDLSEFCARIATSGGADALIVTTREIERMSVLDGPDDALDRAMFSAKAAFFLTKRIGGMMSAKRHGAIVYVGSVHAEKPTGACFGFSCAMAAVGMLSKEAALQLGRRGVHCVCVELGPVVGDENRMSPSLSPIYDGAALNIPRRRLCRLDELCALVDCAITNPILNGASLRADAGFALKYIDR